MNVNLESSESTHNVIIKDSHLRILFCVVRRTSQSSYGRSLLCRATLLSRAITPNPSTRFSERLELQSDVMPVHLRHISVLPCLSCASQCFQAIQPHRALFPPYSATLSGICRQISYLSVVSWEQVCTSCMYAPCLCRFRLCYCQVCCSGLVVLLVFLEHRCMKG